MIVRAIPFLWLGLSVAACGGSEDGVEAAGRHEGRAGAMVFHVDDATFREGESSFELRIETSSGLAVEGADVAVRAVMPSMGHEPTWDAAVEELEPGVYDVNELLLDMPGTWEVRVHAHTGALEDDVSFVVDVL